MESEKGLSVTEIYELEQHTEVELPLFELRIPACFPSPGDDYADKKLDLNEFLIKHPAATFLVKVSGNSMKDAGIHDGDTLIVDRALEATDKSIVVAIINGDFTVKRIHMKENKVYLVAENTNYSPIEVTPEMSFEVWGVVAYVIHKPI